MIEALGPFDLDPCSPVDRPWDTAALHYSIENDGLHQDWAGMVWMNPPYSEVEFWMARLAEHNDGIAIVFARTETQWWFDTIWGHAASLLFIRGRVTFYMGDGTASKAGHNSGGPSVLVAYGTEAAARLAFCGIPGALVVL